MRRLRMSNQVDAERDRDDAGKIGKPKVFAEQKCTKQQTERRHGEMI